MGKPAVAGIGRTAGPRLSALFCGRAHLAVITTAPRLLLQLRSDCYFVSIRLGAVLGVCSAGEITNVTQAFQPSGRFWLANSQ
jgi:hypothetical protein